MKPYLLIINPVSGLKSNMRLLPKLIKRLDSTGIDYDVVLTKGPGDGHSLAAKAAEDGRYAVIACGGDGTVNEIASALVGTRTAMGIIPAGSGNGLARHLGIPLDVDRAVRVIERNNIIAADYGTANGKPFFCTFGVGFDAKVSERCAREHRRGLAMYLKNVVDEYFKFEPEQYVIQVNGQMITERAFLVVCCNASQYGNNAFIAPQASVTDGELDVTIVYAGNVISQAIVGIDMLSGFIRKNGYVNTFRAKSLRIIRKDNGAAHLDGDASVMPSTIDVECHKAKLRIFAPTEDTRFKPIITPLALTIRDIGSLLRNLLPIKINK